MRNPRLSILLCSALALSLAIGCGGNSDKAAATPPSPVPVQTSASAWTFAIQGDTQWTGLADDGRNPNSVAVDVIHQLDQEFIKQGVKFVVAVGDVTDNGSALALDTRATYAQELYNAGIGFFPLRGNHEASRASGIEFARVFPQTQDGGQNATPTNAFITTTDAIQPPAVAGSAFSLGTNFTSPSTNLKGLSYAFDYNNVRFVLLDQFTPTDGAAAVKGPIADQLSWIDKTLWSGGRAANSHALVFGHKGLITSNHTDVLFGNDPSQDASSQDIFINSLYANNVRYYFGGHDHIHDRQLVANTKGSNKITEIVAASASSKFYLPWISPDKTTKTSNDIYYNVPAFGYTRKTPLSEMVNNVGYYIATVDGPKLNVDFYAMDVTPNLTLAGTALTGEYLFTNTTPTLNFAKQESFGYSLNGKEFVVAQGKDYKSVADSFAGTTTSMAILGGVNGSTVKDGAGTATSKAVNTGWSARTAGLASDILTLWGMTDLGKANSDTYVLSMTYDPKTSLDAQFLANGWFCLVSKSGANWVNAVNLNAGGKKTFVLGAYSSSYGLGTYGVDTTKNQVWAVVNYTGDFAAALAQ